MIGPEKALSPRRKKHQKGSISWGFRTPVLRPPQRFLGSGPTSSRPATPQLEPKARLTLPPCHRRPCAHSCWCAATPTWPFLGLPLGSWWVSIGPASAGLGWNITFRSVSDPSHICPSPVQSASDSPVLPPHWSLFHNPHYFCFCLSSFGRGALRDPTPIPS